MPSVTESSKPLIASCPCGECEFEVEKMPSVRFLCHCSICQSVYPGDYADAMVIRADKVKLRRSEKLEFHRLKKPPVLDRGICTSCNHPVIGFMQGGVGPKLAFLPTITLRDADGKPTPLRHVYYDTRLADIEDGLPKTAGALKSNLSLALPMIRVIAGG